VQRPSVAKALTEERVLYAEEVARHQNGGGPPHQKG